MRASLPFRRVCSACRALRGLCPRQTLSDPIFLQRIEPSEFDERTYELGESLVSQRPAHDRVRLGDIVPLAVWRGVAVRVRNKRIRGSDVVRLSECHQIVALDAAYLSVGKPGRRVEQREQDAAGGPRELVSQWVIGCFGRRKAPAVRMELLDLDLIAKINTVDLLPEDHTLPP